MGFRGQHVKVTNLSASPPLNWSRDGAIAIDAERLGCAGEEAEFVGIC